MSDKQNAFIARLVAARYQGLGAESPQAALASIPLAQMTNGQKSQVIDRLMGLPEDPDPDMPEVVANARRKGANDSVGKCATCGHQVAVHAGYFYGPFDTGKRWQVHHKQGECSSEPVPEPVEVTEGIYLVDESKYVQAYRTRNGRIGGKVWTGSAWQYQKGAVYLASTGHRLTAAEARAFGASTGRCVFCMRDLTDPRSDPNQGGAGYGPTCAARHNLPWGEVLD